MGWSHAVYFCQEVVNTVAKRVPEVDESMMVKERRVIPDMSRGAIFIYVDNIIALCTDAAKGRL